MKLAIVTFSYKCDEAYAKFNIKAIDKLRKHYPQHEITYYIIDDANNPFEKPVKSDKNTIYKLSSFKRNSNLRGLSSFEGIINSMHGILQESNADMLVKIDSDTVLLSLDSLSAQYDCVASKMYDSFPWMLRSVLCPKC